jgi:[ribosomal protein S18]-alanine N-acetyltransferase
MGTAAVRACGPPSTVEAMDAPPPYRLLVRPMNVADAIDVAGWRYRGQWAAYDLESPAGILDELDLYWAVTDTADSLVGFVCVEAAARVPGQNVDCQFIDVGVGMDPGLAGQGRGPAFGAAVLGHVTGRYPDRPLRAVIQEWNTRSLRFSNTLGFIDVGELTNVRNGREVRYRVVVRQRSS